jgi:hypothetical protein
MELRALALQALAADDLEENWPWSAPCLRKKLP